MTKENYDFIKGFINAYGTIGLIILIIIGVIVFSDKLINLKVLILTPFYIFCNWFSSSYISSKVSTGVMSFINNDLSKYLVGIGKVNVKVKWVKEVNDPILQENGTIIVRMRNNYDDRLRNILSATQIVLPMLVVPLIRNKIDAKIEKAMDTTLLHKMSSRLGKNGQYVFQKYFVEQDLINDDVILNYYSTLLEIDKFGIFIPMFLNELEYISKGLYSKPEEKGLNLEVIKLLDFLLKLAKRNHNEEIDLELYTKNIKMSIVLLAKSKKAEEKGLRPYIDAVSINLKNGSESIYLVAFQVAHGFFDRLIKTLKNYDKLELIKNFSIPQEFSTFSNDSISIALFRKNNFYDDSDFKSKVEENGLIIGSRVEGFVQDVSNNQAFINIKGINAFLLKQNCSWSYIKSCHEVLSLNDNLDFEIIDVDIRSGILELSLKLKENDPWKLYDIPEVDSIQRVEIIEKFPNALLAVILDTKFELLIPIHEINWFEITEDDLYSLINKTRDVKIVEINEQNRRAIGSIRQLDENPWEKIHSIIKVGNEYKGKIIHISSFGVTVDIGNGISAFINRSDIIQAGFEFVDYENNFVLGQILEVVIEKVFIKRQKIRCNLKRNVK